MTAFVKYMTAQAKYDITNAIRYLEQLREQLSSNSTLCFSHDFSELEYNIQQLITLRDTLVGVDPSVIDARMKESYEMFTEIFDNIELFSELAEIKDDFEVQNTIESVLVILKKWVCKDIC